MKFLSIIFLGLFFATSTILAADAPVQKKSAPVKIVSVPKKQIADVLNLRDATALREIPAATDKVLATLKKPAAKRSTAR